MADNHTSGDGQKNSYSSLLDHELYVNNASTQEDPGDQNLWPRNLAKKWILVLFMGTCLLYCARMAMPICAVSMALSFHWTKIDSGLVLGGFYWGYCLTQIMGGYASDKFGGERILVASTALWALITAATPLLAKLGYHILALMTLARFLMGVLQGVFFPSLASLCSTRVVEGERVFLMSTMNSATNVGTLLAGGMGSLLLDSYGWEYMFYCIGGLSGVWALLVWQCLLKGDATSQKMEFSKRIKSSTTATHWLFLLKEPPVWAMVIAHTCVCSTLYAILSWLPTYFNESFPSAKDWVYNVLPWLVAIPSALIGGKFSNFLIDKGFAVVHVRKTMQVCAMGISSFFIMLLSGAVTFPSAVISMSAAICLYTFSSSGVSVNVQDLTPSCAGTIYGFMNMTGALMGLITVSMSGYLIEVTQSWTSVFSLLTLINSTGLGIYIIFGDVQRIEPKKSERIIVL